MILRPPISTRVRSSAASDVYKRKEKQRSREADKQRSREAEEQRSREAEKQRSKEVETQRSSEAEKKRSREEAVYNTHLTLPTILRV